MSYPEQLTVRLLEIDGSSCGTLAGIVELVANSSPPEYQETSGDFALAEVWQTIVSGQTTWKMRIRNRNFGACRGMFTFIRTTAADNPEGDYCIDDNDTPDCSAGKADAADV